VCGIVRFFDLQEPNLKTQISLQRSGTIDSATQPHIPEDLNPQQSRCENISLANTENIRVTLKNNFDIIYNNGTNGVHRYFKLIYMHNELLQVSANHVTDFSDIKYKV
jgi:hypothetical protein